MSEVVTETVTETVSEPTSAEADEAERARIAADQAQLSAQTLAAQIAAGAEQTIRDYEGRMDECERTLAEMGDKLATLALAVTTAMDRLEALSQRLSTLQPSQETVVVVPADPEPETVMTPPENVDVRPVQEMRRPRRVRV